MKRFLFAIFLLTEVLSMKVYAAEVKIRDSFISDISVSNSGDEFVLSHSNADSWSDLYRLYGNGGLIVDGLMPSEIFDGVPDEGILLNKLIAELKNKYQFNKIEYVYTQSALLHQDGGGDAIPYADSEKDSIRIYIWANDTVQAKRETNYEPEYFETNYGLILHIPIITSNYADIDVDTLDWRDADYREKIQKIGEIVAGKFKFYPSGGTYSEEIIPSLYFYADDVSGVRSNIIDSATKEYRKNIIDKNRVAAAQTGGWRQDSGGWWYENGDGTYPQGNWKQIDGKWYLFNEDGYMQTGWRQMGDKWYYLNGGGAMAVNTWIGSYYVGTDGAMQVNAVTPDGYYVGSDGKWIPDNPDYTAFIHVLEINNAEKFALYDLNGDGTLELFLEIPDEKRFSSKLSVYELEGGQAEQRLNSVEGGSVAVRRGSPYIAVHKIHTELWMSYLYDGSDSYKLIMESLKGGETDDPLPDWGEKSLFVQTIQNARLLNFVTNNQDNRDQYVMSGTETGYAGEPNLEDSYMGWLWGM